jgi:hypothetical protein
VSIGFKCRCSGQNGCRFKCSHTFLQCIPRQMLVCCVVSVLALIWKSVGRAPSLRVLPWHLPYNRGKSTEKPQSG